MSQPVLLGSLCIMNFSFTNERLLFFFLCFSLVLSSSVLAFTYVSSLPVSPFLLFSFQDIYTQGKS